MLLPAGFSILYGRHLLTKMLLPKQNAFLSHCFHNLRYRFLTYSSPFSPRKSSRGPLLHVDYAMATSEPTPLLFWDLYKLCELVKIRDLNLRLGCSLCGHLAYPGALTSIFYDVDRLLVWQENWKFLSLVPQSVLYPANYLWWGYASHIFRKEPAITAFVWLLVFK